MIGSRDMAGEVVSRGTRGNGRTVSIAVATQPSSNERSKGVNALNGKGFSPLDKRREELECGVGGDHDIPYWFTEPSPTTQVLAWMKLLVRAQDGTLQP
jgi:hypothetical protein